MDIELVRTFLEIVGAGSFVGAAPRLNVTQSTVSMRVRLLEEHLGVRLFVRNKGGAALTPAGQQFQRHAAALVRIWQQARQDVALPTGFRATLRIGGEAGLWNRWLHLWVTWMRSNAPDVALRCEVGLPDGLTHNLLEGLLDIGVMYSPQSQPGLTIVPVAEEELVMVEAGPHGGRGGGKGSGATAESADQIYVDWGDAFRRQHRMTFPDFPSPALFIGLGTLGFDYLLGNGGRGYFPRGLAEPHLASRKVRIVPHAATFLLPIYAVHASSADPALIGPALTGLSSIVAEKPDLAEHLPAPPRKRARMPR